MAGTADRSAPDEGSAGSGHRAPHIILTLRADVRLDPDVRDLLGGAALPPGALDHLGGVLRRAGLRAEPLIAGEVLHRYRRAVRSSSAVQLDRTWRLSGPRRVDVTELLAVLRRVPGVASASVPRAVREPERQVSGTATGAGHRVTSAAPAGIDVGGARHFKGGRGELVGLVDVEQGWQLDHRAFSGRPPIRLLHGVNRHGTEGYGSHGTEVLGIITGSVDGDSTVAVAPGLARLAVCSHYTGSRTPRLAEAVLAALGYLTCGDVLLLEFEYADGLPAESDPVVAAAIELAVAEGIVVVEAAGNGAVDLDALLGPASPDLDEGVPPSGSGAVVVAAARSRVEIVDGRAGHRWLMGSNYGRRVDCYAWGEDVVTATRDGHRRDFGGSSAAAAVVAGAAAVLQGMHRAAHGGVLAPRDVRALLRSGSGTEQVPRLQSETLPIGVMPDLRRLAEEIDAVPVEAPGLSQHGLRPR